MNIHIIGIDERTVIHTFYEIVMIVSLYYRIILIVLYIILPMLYYVTLERSGTNRYPTGFT